MKTQVLLITLFVWCVPVHPVRGLDCSRELSAKEWDSIADAWRDEAGDFIYQVWSIARGDLSPQEREKRYNECTKRLVSKARELKIRTESLVPLAQACIEEEESHRRPPPGWDPDDAKGNLASFQQYLGSNGSNPSSIARVWEKTLQVGGCCVTQCFSEFAARCGRIPAISLGPLHE